MAKFEVGGTGHAGHGVGIVRRVGADGAADHPDAIPGCPVCQGGGLLDDGEYAAALVPCLCTGRCPADASARVRAAYPDECRRLAVLVGGQR